MSIWVVGLVAVAALTATYLFRVRSILRSGEHCGMPGATGLDAELGQQVAALREELRVLRAQDALDRPRAPSRRPAPLNT